MTWLLSLASSRWFWWVAIGGMAVIFIGIVALRIFGAGKASAQLEVALTTLARTLEARKAVSEVDHSEEAVKNDPRNRDPR